MIHAGLEDLAGRGLIRTFKKPQKGARSQHYRLAQSPHFPRVGYGAHGANRDPLAIFEFKQRETTTHVALPGARQQGILAPKVIHLTVEKTELPKYLERIHDEFWRRVPGSPGAISRGTGLLKQFADNFFFAAKVKVQIPWTNLEVLCNMIGSDRDRAGAIKKFNTGS